MNLEKAEVEEIYIARLDMVIKPIWDENKFKYLDIITWNEAIEKAAQVTDDYTAENIRKLKK